MQEALHETKTLSSKSPSSLRQSLCAGLLHWTPRMPLATRAQRIQRLTHTQVVVSLAKVNPQPADLAAALLHRVVADSLAPPTLVDSARRTRPHRTTRSAAAPQLQAILSVEETQTPDLARATPPTRDQALHSEEETLLLLAMRHKALLPLPSNRSLRKMALALVRPVLIRVSPCNLSTRTRVSRS